MKSLIVGFGKTGLSIAQYLMRKNIPFDVFEEKESCENLSLLKNTTVFHQMSAAQLETYATIYLSPGVNPHAPLYACVQHKLSNDLNLFTHHVTKPFIAITGSNGKSTLVHLLEAALRGAGYQAIAIGNNGVAMLDHVDDEVDYFVLELSSYQLELASPFVAEVAYVSNISQDHLDRHGSIEHYADIKAKLYPNCRYAVVNDDDAFCRRMKVSAEKIISVSIKEVDQLPPLKIMGQHNQHNALAVLAICELLNIERSDVMTAVANFPGLEHRCEFVLEKNGVTWWNDSKGTNVGSTIVAIQSLYHAITGKLVIILGGQGKGQDFSPLLSLLKDKVRFILLLGENKHELKKLFLSYSEADDAVYAHRVMLVENLVQAVNEANKHAEPHDAVLLSPACASLDMFKSYEDRGRQFKHYVQEGAS